MLLKILVVLSIPAMIAGYIHHLWSSDQQYWAEKREAAELRYANSVEAACRLGEITDSSKCAGAVAYLTTRVALSN